MLSSRLERTGRSSNSCGKTTGLGGSGVLCPLGFNRQLGTGHEDAKVTAFGKVLFSQFTRAVAQRKGGNRTGRGVYGQDFLNSPNAHSRPHISEISASLQIAECSPEGAATCASLETALIFVRIASMMPGDDWEHSALYRPLSKQRAMVFRATGPQRQAAAEIDLTNSDSIVRLQVFYQREFVANHNSNHIVAPTARS